MSDYPDWTTSIELLGSTIMVPMDFQGATVMAPMDVQGATIKMPIDIQAQLVDLDINIVAQDVDLTINIVAQTVGVYLQPEWAAKEGQDKNFQASNTNCTWGQTAYGLYTVPTGKALYICGISGQMEADTAANYDHHLYANVWLYDNTNLVDLAIVGGLGGASLTFPKPIKISAGVQVKYQIVNRSNISCNLAVTMWGYEI